MVLPYYQVQSEDQCNREVFGNENLSVAIVRLRTGWVYWGVSVRGWFVGERGPHGDKLLCL